MDPDWKCHHLAGEGGAGGIVITLMGKGAGGIVITLLGKGS